MEEQTAAISPEEIAIAQKLLDAAEEQIDELARSQVRSSDIQMQQLCEDTV